MDNELVESARSRGNNISIKNLLIISNGVMSTDEKSWTLLITIRRHPEMAFFETQVA